MEDTSFTRENVTEPAAAAEEARIAVPDASVNTQPEQKSKKKRSKVHRVNAIMVWIMMAPGLLYLLINNFLPLYGLTMAFREPDFSLDSVLFSPFNGFENFEFIFSDPTIWLYVRNTILYNLVFMALNIVIPITVAILFTLIRAKWAKKTYQTCLLFPNLMSWVIVSYIALALFSNENGLINAIIKACGGTGFDFYSEDAQPYWPVILTLFNVWKTVGFQFLFYYSALLGINPSLYEAAKLDGATYWQQVKYVSLPGIKPMIITLFVMGLAGMFRSDYGLFYLVTSNAGPLYPVTQTIDTFVFNALKGNGDFVSSSAVGLLQSVIGFILIVGANLVLRKVDKENALF